MTGDWITIVGYGSLMVEQSARQTCPSLRNFRAGRLLGNAGMRRTFNLVSISSILSNISNWETNEVAAVVLQKGCDNSNGEAMLVSVFDIPSDELDAYKRREARYEFCNILVYPWSTGDVEISKALEATVCVQYAPQVQSHSERHIKYIEERYGTDIAEYHNKVGQYYSGELWRKDIYPVRPYLELCLRGAYELASRSGVDNFINTTYLADESTPISQYLAANDQLAMEVLPFTK